MSDQPIGGVLEPKERRHFSPSELTEFFSCPLRRWYRYRLGLWSDTTSSYFAMGSAVHAGLERFYGEKIAGRPRDPDGARVFYRRAAGAERAQLKWFAAVAALSAPALRALRELSVGAGVGGGVAATPAPRSDSNRARNSPS